MKLLLLTLPVIFMFLHRIRGSTMKQLFGRNLGFIKNGAIFAALGIALLTFLITQNWQAGLVMFPVYLLAESFGYSKWIRTIPHWGDPAWQKTYNETIKDQITTGNKEGIHWLTSRFVREDTDFEKFAKVGFFIRGLYWWIPIFAVFSYYGVISPLISIVSVPALAAAFPIIYRASFLIWGRTFMAKSEYVIGALQGSIFALGIWFT